MSKGVVRRFNNQRGFGFISDSEGNDVFVHYTGISGEGFKTLEEGQEVEFDIVQGEKGPQDRSGIKEITLCRTGFFILCLQIFFAVSTRSSRVRLPPKSVSALPTVTSILPPDSFPISSRSLKDRTPPA